MRRAPSRRRSRRPRAAPRSRSVAGGTAPSGFRSVGQRDRRRPRGRRRPCVVDIPHEPASARTSRRSRSRTTRAAPLDRLAHRLRPGVRVAVEIAADPAPEPQRRARRAARARSATSAGAGVPEALLEEPEPLPDLVDDPRSHRAHLVGLPQDRDLLRERRLDGRALTPGSGARRRAGRGARRSAGASRGSCAAAPRSGGPSARARPTPVPPLRGSRRPIACSRSSVLDRLVERLAQHTALALDLARRRRTRWCCSAMFARWK